MIDGSVSIEDVATGSRSLHARRVLGQRRGGGARRTASGVSGKRSCGGATRPTHLRARVITLPYVEPDGGQLVGAQNLGIRCRAPTTA
jgi:hypothetical protein